MHYKIRCRLEMGSINPIDFSEVMTKRNDWQTWTISNKKRICIDCGSKPCGDPGGYWLEELSRIDRQEGIREERVLVCECLSMNWRGKWKGIVEQWKLLKPLIINL